jgi:tetratricopeptide (TPR) repeat protein
MNILRLIIISILLLITCFVQANEEDKRYLLSKESYDLLMVVRDEMEAEKYQIVIQKLNNHLDKEDIKPYDMAVIKQTLGYAYNAMGDYKLSIESFVKAVSSNALPDNVAHELNYIIAQLLIQSERYTEGINYLDRWFEKETNPSPEAHILIASAYYQTNQFKKLIPHAKSALEKSDAPQQSWYELLLAGYYETKTFRKAASLLETMINIYPDNDSYWLQLAAVYQQNNQERKGLAISELAYEKGILNGNDIIQLAQTYLYLQMPLKASTILDTELNNGKIESSKLNIELLLNSLLLAHEIEQAAQLLERFAPKFNDASLYYKLGHIYVELEDWDNAKSSLESVVTKNQFKSQRDIQASTWLLLGISSYHKKDMHRSAQALKMALGFKETREQAAWWLEQIEETSSKEPDSRT